MHETTTHIAGFRTTVEGRTIQRCSWCGEKLVDSLNCSMPLNEDGTPPVIGTFEPGRLVRMAPGRMTLLQECTQLPADACIELVE